MDERPDQTSAERSSTPSAGEPGHAESEAPHGPREADRHLTLVTAHSESEAGEVVDQDAVVHHAGDGVREVDRRNGHAARARAKDAAEQRVVEDEAGNVHRVKATSLVIPEEKRCRAMTVRGARCRVGKMRGMEVCVFHAHTALTDEGLATLADPEVKPRLSPRKALKAVVALRAEEMAEAAVDGAVSAAGRDGGRAILATIDAVDPLVSEEATITLSREGVEQASLKQLLAFVGT